MRFENSILKSSLAWVALATALSSCAGGPVVSVDPCVEIPFIDAPEGACANTITHKAYLVNAGDWKKQRPYMIMIRAADWTKIKLKWLEGCRMLPNADDCNVQVDSVDRAIKAIDQIAGSVLAPVLKP